MEEDEMSGHCSVQEEEEEETSASNNKRLKSSEEEDQDRISYLPESIIVSILSLLPTKDAIRTGLLSKRWQYLWANVPNLAFTYQGSSQQLDEFFDFMANTLTLHSSPKLNKWSLYLSLDYLGLLDVAQVMNIDSLVSLGLRFATIRKVEELRLELLFHSDLSIVMPGFLYTHSSSLTKLFTRSCNFLPFSGQVSWGLLKELTMWETKFFDGVLDKILLGCPLLEYLELKMCVEVPNIDTASNPGLKTLVLEGVEVLEGKASLEISIPTVTSLQVLGQCNQTLKLLNISSLQDVTLDFEIDVRKLAPRECCEHVWQLLQRVHLVKKLTVGAWCIQVLSVAMVREFCPPLSTKNWTCLILATSFEAWDSPGVASLLRSSPYLEKLVIDSPSSRSHSLKLDHVDYPNARDFWSSQQPGSFCCLQRLMKTIHIAGLEPQSYREGGHLIYDNDRLLEFIKFLLQNANVLEKLVISAPKDPHSKMDNYHGISQQLLSFPRSSAQAIVLLPR